MRPIGPDPDDPVLQAAGERPWSQGPPARGARTRTYSRSRERVALVAADELASLMETAHLLRSPRNASRLLSALRRALKNGGRPKSVTRLRDELGLGR